MAADRSKRDRLREHLLILRCQAGDEAAFARLYRDFAPRTLRYLQGLLGSEGADDVQQEVWLSVFRRIAGLADPAAWRTWLFATTRNRAIDHLRRQKREHELREASGQQSIAEATGPDSPHPLADDLAAALDRLVPIHRDVLMLKYRDDLNYAEIALVQGCSIGTVRSRLHHARARLADAITAARQTDNRQTTGETP